MTGLGRASRSSIRMMERGPFDNEPCAGGPSVRCNGPRRHLRSERCGEGPIKVRRPICRFCRPRNPLLDPRSPWPVSSARSSLGSTRPSRRFSRRRRRTSVRLHARARASACPTLTPSALRVSDLQSFTSHVVRLAKAGVRPLLSGSMGEAHHLSHAERATLIKTARKALDENGFQTTPIIAGTGAGSTRETIELSIEAAEAGADYTIVICSGYFAGALAGNRKALKAFSTLR